MLGSGTGSRFCLILALGVVASSAVAQATEFKPRVEIKDYDTWERLGAAGISKDGRWVYASISRGDGKNRVLLRNSDGPEKIEVPYARGVSFSDDGEWATFVVGVSREEAQALAAQRKPVPSKVVLKKLSDGSERAFENGVSSFFTEETGKLVVTQRAESTGPGDVLVVDLESGSVMPFRNVTRAATNEEGTWLAMVSSGGTGMEALNILRLDKNVVHPVLWGDSKVGPWTVSEDGSTLAAMWGKAEKGKAGAWNKVVVVSGMDDGELDIETFDPKDLEGFDEGHRVIETSGLRLTEDGDALTFGSQEWKKEDRARPKPNTVSDVEIWHSKDTTVMPLQKNTAAQERAKATVWVMDLGSEDLKKVAGPELSVTLLPGFEHAVLLDAEKYATSQKIMGLEYSDAWLLDIDSGKKTMVMEKGISNAGGLGVGTLTFGPEGEKIGYYKDGSWWLMDVDSGERMRMSAGGNVDWSDFEDDSPLAVRPSARRPRWSDDGTVAFFSTKHDVYAFDAKTGRLRWKTDGLESDTVYALMDMDPSDDGMNSGGDHYFALQERRTKATGIARRSADGEMKILTGDDKRIRVIGRSEGTDRVLFRMESFEDSPNLYLTNLEFSAVKPLTKTNPQQEKYAWGRSELVNYKNSHGVELQGKLVYPAGWKEGRSYPMVTVIYERMSDTLHQYHVPGSGQQYDVQHYSQNGYFVLMPDIVYTDSDPGMDSVDCVEAAVEATLKKGVGVDRGRIGLTGHSWGGYQTVFIATQSKMFAAYLAGAPLTEYITMSNSFYFNWGETNQVIFESSQGRMKKPWFEDVDGFIRNSPLFHAQNIKKPMLVEAGTVDGAVDWTQAQFLYNTLRRMGREDMVLLVYPGENHGLAKRANVKDFSRRIYHFFDVHLKGKKADKWLSEGIKFVDHAEERKLPKEFGG